jgi:DNA-binding beta-propeller fold protein YncE
VLVATSNDQTVSLYDIATGTRIGDPIPTDAPFSYPGFVRPDGDAVAVTTRQGVAVRDIDPPTSPRQPADSQAATSHPPNGPHAFKT